MKKIILSVFAALALLTGCEKLDLKPTSSLTDANAWKSEGFYDAFVAGVNTRFREHSYNMFLLGEGRSDVFGGQPFGGEAPQGMDKMPLNALSQSDYVLGNYAAFYTNINQLNLLIKNGAGSEIISGNKKGSYIGMAYAMRAYYYFHLIKSWGDVVLVTEPTTSIDISNLAKAVTPVAEVIKQITADIEASIASFGTNYGFLQKKGYWSLSATLMLKADLALWNARNGGSATEEANKALAALDLITTNVASLKLLDNYADVFAYENKGNAEIIFAVRSQLLETSMWNGGLVNSFLPGAATMANYYTSTGDKVDMKTQNLFGLQRMMPLLTNYDRFSDKDSRKTTSMKGVYDKINNNLVLIGLYPWKYQGVQEVGSTGRSMYDDYPIYRFAELLLFRAEAKMLLGQSPKDEIDAIRKRAYGVNYNEATFGFPNMAGDTDIAEAILEERFKEFLFEGKRWYDLRRFGTNYVVKYTTLTNTKQLLWPIDLGTLTNNPALDQTNGYK